VVLPGSVGEGFNVSHLPGRVLFLSMAAQRTGLKVKVLFDGEIRVVRLPDKGPFGQLLRKLDVIYPRKFAKGVCVRYEDEDGDIITVTSDRELMDAFEGVSGSLRLAITANQKDMEDSDGEFVKISSDVGPNSESKKEVKSAVGRWVMYVDDSSHLAYYYNSEVLFLFVFVADAFMYRYAHCSRPAKPRGKSRNPMSSRSRQSNGIPLLRGTLNILHTLEIN